MISFLNPLTNNSHLIEVSSFVKKLKKDIYCSIVSMICLIYFYMKNAGANRNTIMATSFYVNIISIEPYLSMHCDFSLVLILKLFSIASVKQ